MSKIPDLTAASAIADDDDFAGNDKSDTAQSAAGSTRRFTWSLIKSTLQTAFDSRYVSSDDGNQTINGDVKFYDAASTTTVEVNSDSDRDGQVRFTDTDGDRGTFRYINSSDTMHADFPNFRVNNATDDTHALNRQTGDSRYRPPTLYLAADSMKLMSGVATADDVANLQPYWSMPDGSTSTVAGVLSVPSTWAQADASIEFFNPSATSGNVAIRIDYGVYGDGDILPRTVGTTTAVAAPSTANESMVSPTLAADIPLTAGDRIAIAASRSGGAGSDTLTNAVGFLGVLLTRTDP